MITQQELDRRVELNALGFWEIPDNLDCTGFDFNWRPEPWERPYIHQFGTQWQKTGGPRFVVPENEGVKYQDCQKATRLPDTNDRGWRPLVTDFEFDYSWHPDDTEPPFIYVFGNQWYSAEVMPTLMYRVKGATQKKYMNSVCTKLLPNKSKWEIPNDIDDSMFDYSWVPNPHEPPMNFQFGTQWQKTGGPKFVCNGSSSVKYVDTMRVRKLPNKKAWRGVECIYEDSFDYSWHPDSTEEPYNYVFGSIFNTPSELPVLVYKTKNSVGTKYVDNVKFDIPIDVITYEDSIYDAVVESKFTKAYAYVTKTYDENFEDYLYTEKPSIHLLPNSAIVPRIAKTSLHDKLYDYAHVVEHGRATPELLDVVFFSNGEACADQNYEHLVKVVSKTGNRVVRIDGVKGRVASQHAAANASNTSWYFLVNAKLQVNENFDFTWQPDIYKSRRHYIFVATNNLNRLEYGHQAMVANNKKLTLATEGKGLDFTMESMNEVVRINSGVAVFNSSPWDTWRTAFRECIKLQHANDHESRFRLNVWKTIARGEYGEYSLKGAKDAIDYYNSVNGEFDKLKLTYEWQWLWEYFNAQN